MSQQTSQPLSPSAFVVPVIDISPYVSAASDRADSAAARADVARRVDEAARTVGFMQITGHGIPTGAWDGLGAAIDEFFTLPLEVKKQYTAPKGVNRGYTAPKSERLSLSLGVEKAERMNDFFEAFNVGVEARAFPGLDLDEQAYATNLWPTQTRDFRRGVGAWMAHAEVVSRCLTTIFADALGLPVGFFDGYTDHSLNVLRMNNYALPPGERVEVDGDLIGMGEHTDFGIVTLLWADDVKGLQVLAQDGSWNDVSPVPGALLVNLGDLTARWTNDRWRSTLHRVKPPLVDGTIRRRRSAAFFLDGNHDASIAPLPSCVADGEAPLYDTVTVAEHINAKLGGSRDLQNNAAGTEREARRVTSARP